MDPYQYRIASPASDPDRKFRYHFHISLTNVQDFNHFIRSASQKLKKRKKLEINLRNEFNFNVFLEQKPGSGPGIRTCIET